MDYQQASDVRKKGLISSITDKLVSGQGIRSSVGGALSERTQATVKGFKEKFDILNIAKTLTGGSKFAPALLGTMLGRKKSDIEYFTDTKSKKIKSNDINQSNQMAVEVLGLIYREMVRTEEQRKEDFKNSEEEKNKELDYEDTRNKEIIAALTGRKKPTKKVKVEKKKKETKEKKPKAEVPVIPIGKKGGEAISKLSPFETIQKAITTFATPARIAGGAILGGAAVMGVSNLAQAIGAAEAGGSYDVAFGDIENPKTGKITNVMNLPTAEEYAGKKLSEMTLEEVQKFQRARNAQKQNTGAVGKYQFVGRTLFGSKDGPGLVQRLGLSMDTKFTPQVQDQLNQMLFEDNVSILKKNGVPLTPGNLYMAHYIGAGGASAVYRAAQRGENVTVAQALVNEKLPDPSVQNKELTQIKAKDFEGVLQTKLEKKGLKVSGEPSIPIKGTEIDVASKVNRDAKIQSDVPAPQQKNVNTTNVASSSQNAPLANKEDDRSAYDKKVKQK